MIFKNSVDHLIAMFFSVCLLLNMGFYILELKKMIDMFEN